MLTTPCARWILRAYSKELRQGIHGVGWLKSVAAGIVVVILVVIVVGCSGTADNDYDQDYDCDSEQSTRRRPLGGAGEGCEPCENDVPVPPDPIRRCRRWPC